MENTQAWENALFSLLVQKGDPAGSGSPSRAIFSAFKDAPETVFDLVARTTDPEALRFALIAAATGSRLDILAALLDRPDVDPLANRSEALRRACRFEALPAMGKLYERSNVSEVADDLSDQGGLAWNSLDKLFTVGIKLGLSEVPREWLSLIPAQFPRAVLAMNEQDAQDRQARAPRLSSLQEGEAVRRRSRP